MFLSSFGCRVLRSRDGGGLGRDGAGDALFLFLTRCAEQTAREIREKLRSDLPECLRFGLLALEYAYPDPPGGCLRMGPDLPQRRDKLFLLFAGLACASGGQVVGSR